MIITHTYINTIQRSSPPHRSEYIKPLIAFEDIEEESFVCQSVGGEGSNMESGGPGGFIEIEESKQSSFVFEEDYSYTIE